jgi:hypothetical protein
MQQFAILLNCEFIAIDLAKSIHLNELQFARGSPALAPEYFFVRADVAAATPL